MNQNERISFLVERIKSSANEVKHVSDQLGNATLEDYSRDELIGIVKHLAKEIEGLSRDFHNIATSLKIYTNNAGK